ncbi:MAG: hypothetical protein K2X82_08385 [Gemmataceae bacterium]|nr:hypothetical protein [Gemmataceae bacterium]
MYVIVNPAGRYLENADLDAAARRYTDDLENALTFDTPAGVAKVVGPDELFKSVRSLLRKPADVPPEAGGANK